MMSKSLSEISFSDASSLGKKAQKSPKFKNRQKGPKKPGFFWVIQFRIVQNELWYTWAFFY